MTRLTLTFDNGPDPECTPAVLDVLKARGVRASFFVCGQGNRLHPALKADTEAGRSILRRAKREGHWIGNHTLTHTVELGTTRDPAVVAREIGRNQDLLGSLNDRRLFRPYMGGGVLSRRTYSPERFSTCATSDTPSSCSTACRATGSSRRPGRRRHSGRWPGGTGRS